MDQTLYQARILEHAQHPRNKAEMLDPDIRVPAKNPSCGDSLILYLRLKDGSIQEASFSGVGCAISEAAASMLTETLVGKSIAEAAAVTDADVYRMLGIELTIGRQKCALLAWRALQQGLSPELEAEADVPPLPSRGRGRG